MKTYFWELENAFGRIQAINKKEALLKIKQQFNNSENINDYDIKLVEVK